LGRVHWSLSLLKRVAAEGCNRGRKKQATIVVIGDVDGIDCALYIDVKGTGRIPLTKG